MNNDSQTLRRTFRRAIQKTISTSSSKWRWICPTSQWKNDKETKESNIRFPGSPLWIWMELWFLSMINPSLEQWKRCRHFHHTF